VSAISCGTATITSQFDADLLRSACPTVTGDVILAANAAGSITLDGIQIIEGSLVSDACSGSCSSLTSLISSTLTTVSRNISLQGLSGLTTIFLPQLQVVGAELYLDTLPVLQNLSTPVLVSVGQVHLVAAPSLTFINLTQIQNVTGQNPSVLVSGVASDNLQGFNVNSNLSSFILRDCPNLKDFGLSTPQIDYIEIAGNGSLGFGPSASFSGFSRFMSKIGTMKLSGSSAFSADLRTVFDNMILDGNTFTELELQSAIILSNLSITNNADMTGLLLPKVMSTIQNIAITGNSIQGINIAWEGGGIGEFTWPWGITNASSMVFEGSFQPFFL
jgi:hypothetical protein